jgi:hypothetical protein
MGYRVLSPREAKWQPRKGLEGPFWFVDRVLYYDPRAGEYWDPTTDFYLEQAEVDMLQQQVVDILSR